MSDGKQVLSIPADLTGLETLRQFIEVTLAAFGASESLSYDLVLAANEVATNTIMHGYKGTPGMIELTLRQADDRFELRLRDDAPPFDPTTVPAPRTDLPLEMRQPGGLGLLLTRHFTDEFSYSALPEGGNEVTLVKYRAVAADTDQGATA